MLSVTYKWSIPSKRELPGVKPVCSSGQAQIGLILVVIFIDWSSCLPVNSIDKIDVFILALVSCSVCWLSCIQLADSPQDMKIASPLAFFFFWLSGDWDVSQRAMKSMELCERSEKSRLSERKNWGNQSQVEKCSIAFDLTGHCSLYQLQVVC